MNDLIYALRKVLGLNQRDFAKFLGRSNVTVSRWETGARMSEELETGIRIGIMACKYNLPVEEIVAMNLPSLSTKEEPGEYRTDGDD